MKGKLSLRFVRRMRIACWISKATDIHSECVLLIAFLRQQQFRESSSILHLYIYCLAVYALGTSCFVHTAEVCVGSKATHCEVCGVQIGTGTDNSTNTVGFTCQYRSAVSPQPDLLPDVFCLMVRIFLLMLVLLYIQY